MRYFVTNPCERRIVHEVLDQARIHGVDLRVVPDMYEGQALANPIEYIGQFPTIPLHHGRLPEISLVIKRVLDVVVSSLVLLILAPVLFAIAIAIKLDSSGPVFYRSQRIGKKGYVFRCIKFRTMIADADKRLSDLMHLNERDGVLFKIANDPRITRLGQFLRKYSLNELPQLFNVLSGDVESGWTAGHRLRVNWRVYGLAACDGLCDSRSHGLWQVEDAGSFVR